MQIKNTLSYVTCLLVLAAGLRSTDEYSSSTSRPTDFVFQINEEARTVEAKQKEAVEFQDFSNRGTDSKHRASIPDRIFLHPNSGADAIVSNPADPREVLMIQRKHGRLGLPGGFVGYGEDPYFAAVRKFMEEINFKITEVKQVKKEQKEEQDEDEFEEVEVTKLVAAGPYPGFFGRTMMSSMTPKSKSIRGPLLGIFGVANRDPRKQAISFVYHMSIGDRFTAPVPGGDSKDALFCSVPELLARNLEEVTDEAEMHPLHELSEKLEQKDALMVEELQNQKPGSTLKNSLRCAIEVDFDYLKMLNKYYLSMVALGIVTEAGELTDKAEHLKVYYNKDALKTARSQNML